MAKKSLNTGGNAKRGSYARKDYKAGQREEQECNCNTFMKEHFPGSTLRNETGVDPKSKPVVFIKLIISVMLVDAYVTKQIARMRKHTGLISKLQRLEEDLGALEKDELYISAFLKSGKSDIRKFLSDMDPETIRTERFFSAVSTLYALDVPDKPPIKSILDFGEDDDLEQLIATEPIVETMYSKPIIGAQREKLSQLIELLKFVEKQPEPQARKRPGAPPHIEKLALIYFCDRLADAHEIKPFTAQQIALLAQEMDYWVDEDKKFEQRVKDWENAIASMRGKRKSKEAMKILRNTDHEQIVSAFRRLVEVDWKEREARPEIPMGERVRLYLDSHLDED